MVVVGDVNEGARTKRKILLSPMVLQCGSGVSANSGGSMMMEEDRGAI